MAEQLLRLRHRSAPPHHTATATGLLVTALLCGTARAEPPALEHHYPVLREDFADGLRRYDGRTGLWSTLPPRNVLVTNGPMSVFLDQGVLDAVGEEETPDPFRVEDGGLSIVADELPDGVLPAVRDYLRLTGQQRHVDTVRYYTGQINTHQTWAQTYGYLEIVARIPKGKGLWPAFWLTHAGVGWPPEIDVFEAYGKGLAKPTPRDDQFNVAVFFDAIDAEGEATQSVDITNPFDPAPDGSPAAPERKTNKDAEQFVFHKRIEALADQGADIYDGFWTYAVDWSPETITFYFGKTRDSLEEVYRVPTPDDLHAPMYVIANNQVSTRGGWWDPVPGYDAPFTPDNPFRIESITIMGRTPSLVLNAPKAGPRGEGYVAADDRDSVIRDAPGPTVIETGAGQDIVELADDGGNTVTVSHGIGNKVLRGFSANDRLVLRGFSFDGTSDALSRLTQVGDDTWLADGAYPVSPQTIVFADTRVSDIAAAQIDVRWSETPDVWLADLRRDGSRLKDDDGDGVVTALPGGSKLTDGGDPKRLVGSAAGDIFFVYDGATTIEEAKDGGVDTAEVMTDYTLPDNVENIVAHGRSGRRLIRGNTGGNRIDARGEAMTLAGGPGDDLIVLHGSGPDTVALAPGDGHDTIVGFASNDTLRLATEDMAAAARKGLAAARRSAAPSPTLTLGPDQSITFEGAGPNLLGTLTIQVDVID